MPAIGRLERWGGILTAIAILIPAGRPLLGQDRSIHGKVVMEDGSRLPEPVPIQRVCPNQPPAFQTGTNSRGEYSWNERASQTDRSECFWRAVLKGYFSTEIDFATLQKNSLQADIVLHKRADFVSREVGPRWERASEAIKAGNWTGAESELRPILADYPKLAPAWSALGVALEGQQKHEEARRAYEIALQTEPSLLGTYHLLASLQMRTGDWASARKTAAAGLGADSPSRDPALYLDVAMDGYRTNAEGAEAAARKAIALDKNRELPKAEYVLGLILEAAQDYSSAALHFKKYLELSPKSPEADEVRARIEKLAASKGGEPAATLASEPALPAGADEVVIPGGLGALAAMARLPRTPSGADFFVEYCRAVAERFELQKDQAATLGDEIHAYMTAATVLSALADPKTGRATLSLGNPQLYEKTVRALRLLGWVVVNRDGLDRVAPGDQPEDAPRQLVASALGIDEIEMANALSSGGSFEFEIRSGRAAFLGASAWDAVLGGLGTDGFAEALARNPSAAAAYAALAAAGADVAAALIASKGVRDLVTRYGEILHLYGDVLTVSGGRAAAPGGPEADAVWLKLAGASPADPKAFFPALLDKDQGRLATFYFALGRGDAAHQKFFTRSAEIASQFYRWYRDSEELRSGFGVQYITWRQHLFRDLPLDTSGAVRFPGGRAAWTQSSAPDAEALLEVTSLEGLAPVARLEDRRRQPLDEESARLLAAHYPSWRALFPYFEKLPALGPAEFQALESFEKAVSQSSEEAQNRIVGEWHSLVKLAELGVDAGSLDASAAALAFRRACDGLSAPDYSAQALAVLRDMARGAGDLDEAVASGLLRRSGERRTAFDRVREMQRVPLLASLGAADDARTLAALSGLVYAALLDPRSLIASEDSQLLARHRFRTGFKLRGADLFVPSVLTLDNKLPGSYFEGGFMTFEEQVKDLARAPSDREEAPGSANSRSGAPSAIAPVGPALVSPAPADPEAVFRASSSLVEVFATVTDGGRYVDDLKREDFIALDRGQPVEIGGFESGTFPASVALLLDSTSSIKSSLAALKASAFRLIHDLRSTDSVAVYCFNSKTTELQPFTRNKDAAKRAVLRTRAEGATGLNDALVRVTRDLAGRPGKRVIVVITDGADNASGLPSDTVILRARTVGVPIYTLANGKALSDARLLTALESVAQATGGLAFAIRTTGGIAGVFERVSQDIEHGYYFTFQPAPGGTHDWRPIEVRLRGNLGRKVRAREGYYSN